MNVLSRRLPVAIVALGFLMTACGADSPDAGGPGAGSPPGTDGSPRVVEIEMLDIAFDPASLDVTAGETVTFKFVNNGKIKHEAIFGDESEQIEHGEEMAAMDMDDDHADMDMEHDVVLEPGASGEFTMTFDEPGSTMIGCHEPGHWEAGMRVDVTINP